VDGSRVSFSFVPNLPPLIDKRLLNSRQTQIDAQMKLLNERYVGTGVSFNYISVTRVLSRYWHETIDAGLYVVPPPLITFCTDTDITGHKRGICTESSRKGDRRQ
jgi:hypothetical protein